LLELALRDILVTRPISLAMPIFAALLIGIAMMPTISKTREQAFREEE
jgi:hypothetical protein